MMAAPVERREPAHRWWLWAFALVVVVAVGAVAARAYLEWRTDLGVVVADHTINVNSERIAIKGYDPVAYFTLGKAMPGKPDLTETWNAAVWRFATAEHRAMFAADPIQYAPQYGGFCAQGVRVGKAWVADPEAWRIVDGRLYLSWSREGVESFVADASARRDADAEWRRVTSMR
jgi:hypothetical protein